MRKVIIDRYEFESIVLEAFKTHAEPRMLVGCCIVENDICDFAEQIFNSLMYEMESDEIYEDGKDYDEDDESEDSICLILDDDND